MIRVLCLIASFIPSKQFHLCGLADLSAANIAARRLGLLHETLVKGLNMGTILMTLAAGGIGVYLRSELIEKYELRLSDCVSVYALGKGERFVAVDIPDLDAVRAAVDRVDRVLHFESHASEGMWEDILYANIIGMRNVNEDARVSGVKRVVWASSNHTVGFYRRD